MSSRKLSSLEVAALVGGLMEQDKDESQMKDGKEVRTYRFGSDNLSVMGDYYALRMINERFCRLARTVFLPMLRIQPRISAFPPEVKRFEDFADGVENFISLTTSRIDELNGNQLMAVTPDFISLLTDSYYGGAIRSFKGSRNEFTATENRVIEIVTEGLNQALEAAWKDLTPIHFNVVNREENLQFATFVDSDDKVVVCSFMVQLPDSNPASFDILYPLQTLKPLASQLRSRMQSDTMSADNNWNAKLRDAILSVPLTVTGRLAEPSIKIGKLTEVTEGSVVRMDVNPKLEMLVEGIPMFDAELGEIDKQSAISLTRKIGPKT